MSNPIPIEVFEKLAQESRSHRQFVFAKYKGRWVETVAINTLGQFMYFFFGSDSNCLMSECITEIQVPERPCQDDCECPDCGPSLIDFNE